mgnify:FL=1|tara:strand:+ start:1372 stop:3504 length:2133 start_codon:yes stop_codon:yes gene_type:complete
MPLTKLQFKPGINREITAYSNEGGWVDCDKIRFRFGYAEKFGGWEKLTTSTYEGTARRLHNWLALDGSNFLGVGTHLKYYIEEGGLFNDITPIRKSTTNSTTFSATNGSANITVTENNHGAAENDFVIFSGAATLGGLITASILNAEHKIVNIINGNSYTITVSSAANASDTGNGGGGTDAVYLINAGLDSQVGGTGWGAGLFGGTTANAVTTTIAEAGNAEFSNSDTTLTVANSNPGHQIAADDFILIEEEILKVTNVSSNDLTVVRAQSGTSASAHAHGTIVRLSVGNDSSSDDFTGWGIAAESGTTREIRTWSHDNFGEDLFINPRDEAVYRWDKTNGLTTRAVEISTISSAENAPTVAKQIMVDENHLIAFGTNIYGTSTQDPLLIRFSDDENQLLFTVRSGSAANFLTIGSGSEFIQAIKTKREILVWTDVSLHSLRYIGYPLYYGIDQITSSITIMGPKAAVAVEDAVFWMGKDNFYVYAGGTKTLPCTVKDKVFLDFNNEQADKVIAGVNSEYTEVIWFYPSESNSLSNGGTGDIDKYVIYNYGQGIWYFGTLARTAWIDRGIRQFPIAAGSPNLFNHETGFDDDGSAMTSFIESAPMDIGDGDKFTLVQKVIPDLTFDGSTSQSSPAANFTLKARNEPGENYSNTSAGTATRTSTSPVETFTNQLNLRARGRSFALRVDSDALGVKWRLGSPRVSIRPDGRR